ncbi:MAG: helix-turn-helix transcriptional regulator, partial [Clostridia bacterium]|nr:helix-turn-helix transcriptional regulator [Clostridia bacterium]
NMHKFFVSITKPKTTKYPLHQHPDWEIMYYLEGEGYLATEVGNIAFKPATIIIVPPKTIHGSVSEDGFVNISISGDFGHLFMFDNIVVQQDNDTNDGERLSKLIFDNRFSGEAYLPALCNAYAHFLLRNAIYEKEIIREISKIVEKITTNFFDPCFDVTGLLKKSSYAEDYIRSEFKKTIAMSPIDFLTQTRINHAKKLIEIYGANISISQVAEECGFEDPVYFSRRFKQFTGMSPTEYKRQIHT